VPAVRVLAGRPPLGYVRLAQFSDTTGRETRETRPGARPKDGRAGSSSTCGGNLGGVVAAAVDVARLFLPAARSCARRGARDGSHAYRTARSRTLGRSTLPLVVLVDESSASASEILAGALQDHGRAVLVGDARTGSSSCRRSCRSRNRDAPAAPDDRALRHAAGRERPRGGVARDGRPCGGLEPDVRVPLRSQRRGGRHAASSRADSRPRGA
jgi:C-terminal processing protease CtpA/Prc